MSSELRAEQQAASQALKLKQNLSSFAGHDDVWGFFASAATSRHLEFWTSPSFLIVNGGSPAERPAPAPGRLPCGENGEEWFWTHRLHSVRASLSGNVVTAAR